MKKVKDSRKRWKQLVTMLLVTALLVTGTPDIVGLASEGTQEQVTTAADQSEGTQAEGQAEAAQEEEAISEEPVEQQDASAQQDTAAKQENTEKNIENRSTAGTTECSENSQNSHEKDKAASGAKSGGSSTSKVRETEKNTKKEDKDTKTEYTYRGSAIQAKVTLKDAEDLSDEADLRVKQTTVANKIKTQIINKAVGEENTQLVDSVRAYDLSFILNGKSVDPSGSMQVTLANLGTKSGQNTLIYQVTDDGQVKNTDAVRTGSDAMQFAAKSLCTYVVLTYTTVSDVNGNDITTLYPAMVTAAQTQLESKEDGNVPVESWTRTNTPLVLKDTTGKKALAWTWSDIAGIDLSLDNDSQIWNGSRSYGKHTSTSLKNGRVTAKSGKLYDSALWKNEGKAGKDTTITRIRGEFTITDKNKNNYAYTLKPVTDSENIYAKDNMFVFVYPKDVELTDDNYMDYLAFWTGSLADAGEKERTFHGRTASNYTQRTPVENVSVLTDGWHMTAACNNAGSIIASTDASDYYVDVISTTDSSNGGMYRFKLVKEKKEKTQFTFRNLDTNAKTGKGGAVFELYKDGVHYSAQSEDEEGRVTFNIVKPEGSDTDVYTLKETKAPEGYDKITTTWKVLVSSEGVTMVKDTEGNEMPKYPDGTYVVSSAKTDEADSTEQTAKTSSVIREYKSDDVNVTVTAENEADLPADAKLVVKPIELSQKAQENVEQAAIKEEKKAIKNILAYDIHFEADGKEVQPGATVKVSVDVPEIKAGANASVFHVDDKNKVENMDGDVDKKGNVVFETTHFSTYAIVNMSDTNTITVTIEHYKASSEANHEYSDEDKIYQDDVMNIQAGKKINNYAKAENWTVKEVYVTVNNNRTKQDTDKEIELTQNATIQVYYQAKSENIQGQTTFYDYTVKAGEGSNNEKLSINMKDNYSNNKDKNSNDGITDRLTVGDYKKQYPGNSYNKLKHNGFFVNLWTGEDENGANRVNKDKAVTGLLKGLNEDGSPKFTYDEPGFFKNENKSYTSSNGQKVYTRRVISDYELLFQKTGDTYELNSVINASGAEQTKAGDNFFPLDNMNLGEDEKVYSKTGCNNNVPYEKEHDNEKTDNKNHNYYFGMRYEITFKLKDYTGPLNYDFTGDDDMWVVLDRNNVIVDLGGIHDAIKEDVNIWEILTGEENPSYAQKVAYLNTEINGKKNSEIEHTITVLYMERGAGASNCNMTFTLPSAEIVQTTDQETTNLTLKKVDSKAHPLLGATFTLVNNKTKGQKTVTSNESGDINFEKLVKGEYTLTETDAPEGYAISQNTWVVKVEPVAANQNQLEAKLYLKNSSGEKECTKTDGTYQIANQTNEEKIKASMDYNKTATVIDWDKRTYKIDINASSKVTSSETQIQKQTADVMLVLDVSGSMLGNRSNETGSVTKMGKYNAVKSSLDTKKIYYLGTSYQWWVKEDSVNSENVEYMGSYYVNLSNPIIYYNGKWVYYYNGNWKPLQDTSLIYSCNSPLNTLKEAAIDFVKATAEASESNTIGITTFNTSATTVITIKNAKNNLESIIKEIAIMHASGGTNPGVGLKDAYDQLTSLKKKNLAQAVLLFTDGEPTGGNTNGEWDSNAKEKTEAQATAIKAKGIKIHTVGLGLSTRAQKWLAGSDDKEGIASPGCAHNATDVSGLAEIFKEIQSTITHTFDITAAEIRDVIDPRFVVVNDDGTAITNKDLEALEEGKQITLGNGGVVSLDKNGNQVVTWTNQPIKHSSSNGNTITPGWSKSITVKAKDEYIGGNNIPTNIYPDSKITTEYGEAILPQPTVNVKMDLVVNNHSEEVFDGERSPYSTDIENALFNKAAPQGYVTDKDGKKILVTYEIGSDGTPIRQDDFALTWYKDEACSNSITPADPYMNASENPRPNSTRPGKYYLKVTYKGSGPATDSSNSNTTISGKAENNKLGDGNTFLAHNSKDENKSYGEYTITVKQGKIIIQKNLLSDPEYLKTDTKEPNFSFKVTRIKDADGNALDSNDSNNLVVRLNKDNFSNNPLTATISAEGLSKGVYQVEEVLPAKGYEFKDGSIDTTEPKCDSVLSENKKIATFAIGYENYSEAGYSYRDGKGLNKDQGKVIFTNQRLSSIQINKIGEKDEEGKDKQLQGARFEIAKKDKDSNKYVKVLNVGGNDVNYIETDANGKASFNNLPEGDYQITEIQSPAGYTLLANPIEVSLPYVTDNSKTDIVKNNSKKVTYDDVDHYYDITYTIKNNKLFNMPASGGRFKATLIGIAVMIMAAGCYILRHRRKRII